MFVSKAIAVSFVLFTVILVARMHTIEEKTLHQISFPTDKVHSAERMLQAVPVSNPQVNAAITKIINNANAVRKGKGLSALTVNSGLQQIVRQWAQSIKGRMSLSQYMQLFAFHTTQAYSFASIPLDYLVDVVERASPALTSRDYNTIGTFSRPADGQNFELIVVLQGGDDSYMKQFSKQDILSIIKAIDSERAAKAAAEKKDVPVQTPSVVNYTKNEPVVIDENKEKVTQNIISSNENINKNNIPSSIPKQSDVKPTNQVNISEKPNVIKQDKPKQSIPSSSNASPVQNKTNLQTNQQKEQPKVTQQPKKTTEQPHKQTQTPKQQQQTKPVQTKPTQVIKKEEPIIKEPQVKEIKQQIPPKVQQTQTKPSPTIPQNTITSNNVTIPEQPKVQKTQQKPSTPTLPIPSEPARQVVNNQSRQRSSSQPAQVNNTSFRNIVLTHNVPSTFVRNQIFPFRGFITVPNPSGVKVNVIFTRVNDQRRLSFSSNLPPNVTNFEILANLALSGNYYLSVFIGLQGQTTLTQYTVIPNFFGRVNAKAPAPLIDASLSLIQNDLWLNWNSSEQVVPTLTQIIFSQQSGASITFLLTNSKTSFQVPYAQFASFSPGLTTISIAQAFSSTESAASRTSDFSAPYSIIFNATTHHFAKYSEPKVFQPIPYRIEANGSVVLKGRVPAGGINNQVLLIAPNKNFISHFITGSNGTRIVQSGMAVDFSIPLRQTGVYILEVNDAAGEALINIPLYVGDIYPLLPDFMDLAPASPDVVALNEPSDIDSRRSIISALINSVRSQYGVPSVYIDNNLNNIAQNYSSKLIQQQIFSHVDRDGNTPSMRAKAAGIQEQIGENLAVNSNLTQAQLMLQRSPIHLRNMVNPLWTRVGIGIVQNSNQVYYLTQQFSSRDMRLFPLTNSELAALQRSIANYILSQFPALRQDRQLSSDLANFQQSASRDDAVAYLSGLGYRRFVVDQVEVPYNGGNVIAGLVGSNYFGPEKQHTKFGVSAVYKGGNALIVAAYN